MMVAPLVLLAGISIGMGPAEGADLKPYGGAASRWNGFARHDFRVAGSTAIVVEPAHALPGRPWAWRGEFFGAFDGADVALVQAGWHLAYLDVHDQFGSPRAMAGWAKLYDTLVGDHGLSPRPALIGLSRGALYCLSWAADHPDRTLAIYLDNGACDYRSWPGGKARGRSEAAGSDKEWGKLLKAYGFADDASALASKLNPIERLASIAGAKVPILLVYGDADRDAIPLENSILLFDRYRGLGGPVDRIVKPGQGHHPHGLADPRPIVDFFERARAARPL